MNSSCHGKLIVYSESYWNVVICDVAAWRGSSIKRNLTYPWLLQTYCHWYVRQSSARNWTLSSSGWRAICYAISVTDWVLIELSVNCVCVCLMFQTSLHRYRYMMNCTNCSVRALTSRRAILIRERRWQFFDWFSWAMSTPGVRQAAACKFVSLCLTAFLCACVCRYWLSNGIARNFYR